jgi:hypothetical protein
VQSDPHETLPKEAQNLLSSEDKESLNAILERFTSNGLESISKKGNRQADWLLLITGGTFVALLSSGLRPPIVWELKILIGFLSASSILGVITWFLRIDSLDDGVMLPLYKELRMFQAHVAKKEPDAKKRNLITLCFLLFFLKGITAAFGEGIPKRTAKNLNRMAMAFEGYLIQGVRGGVAVPTAEFPKINKEAEVVKKAFRIERLAHVQAAILFVGFFVYAVFLLCR